jgi:hypothetical protein
MERRKFIYAAAASGALPFASFGQTAGPSGMAGKELYEIRTYEAKFGGNQNLLKEYLKQVLGKSLLRLGAGNYMVFTELGNSDPANIWVFISYPDAGSFMKAQTLQSDPEYISLAADYNALTKEQALYNRYASSLLLAFDGMPRMTDPVDGASLFELRTYEGYSEDAVRRKIKMFNDEEIDLFLKVALHPVFFGEMIIGPYRPNLTYMLNFKDMEEHDARWKAFGESPEWKEMNSKEIYANSVSNIRKVFLKPL